VYVRVCVGIMHVQFINEDKTICTCVFLYTGLSALSAVRRNSLLGNKQPKDRG